MVLKWRVYILTLDSKWENSLAYSSSENLRRETLKVPQLSGKLQGFGTDNLKPIASPDSTLYTEPEPITLGTMLQLPNIVQLLMGLE